MAFERDFGRRIPVSSVAAQKDDEEGVIPRRVSASQGRAVLFPAGPLTAQRGCGGGPHVLIVTSIVGRTETTPNGLLFKLQSGRGDPKVGGVDRRSTGHPPFHGGPLSRAPSVLFLEQCLRAGRRVKTVPAR